MLERLNRSIKVIVNHSGAPVYLAHYYCAKCKNVHECQNQANCHFVDYVRERIPQTTYKINSDMSVLTAFVANDAAHARALNIIHRAQRMRSNRATMCQKTL